MGTEKRRVQNRWPALKLRIRLRNWDWRMGRRLKFTDLISCSAASVSRDIMSLVLLAETKWWELGAVV